jgi:hypothetical protein
MRAFVGSILLPGLRGGLPLLLGAVFLRSSLAKWLHPFDFLADVYNYELLGRTMAKLVASTIPSLELAVAACLLLGILRNGAMVVSAILLFGFTLVQLSALRRGLSISCGCFGGASAESTVNYTTLIRTLVFLAAAVLGLCLARGEKDAAPIGSARTK